MNNQQVNLLFVDLLNEWDPFQIGPGHYDTEIADILQLIQVVDKGDILASKIQAIYEFSFDEIIPLAECKMIAEKLLMLKNNSSCELE